MSKKTTLKIVSLLSISILISTVWVYITRDMYNYNRGFGTVLGLNIFPLFGWMISLIIGYSVIQFLLDKVGINSLAMQFIMFTAISTILVIFFETLGYYVLGVQNIGTSSYAGLPYCNCLHAPTWMQIGYFVLGPLYWLIYTGLRITSRRQKFVF